MKPVFEVVDGQPLMNGKIVLFACSRDVSSDAEYNYARHLFPDTEWVFEHDGYTDESYMMLAGTKLREDYKEIMLIHDVQMETGDFSEVTDLIPDEVVIQCESQAHVMLFCDPEIEDSYGDETIDEYEGDEDYEG